MQLLEYMNAWVSSPLVRIEEHNIEMARYGNDGWELTTIVWYHHGDYLAFFKRPKPE